ncbi:MAG: thiamine phosphate synthase, partial [Lachnospiraceae bacterium]|nr:thiamine phosphate synthase [Candidatus Merdinaster equi]
MNLNSLKLYAITDSKCIQGNVTLEETVEQAILGGITMLQYREKSLDYSRKKEEAISLHNICKRYGIPFIVNDDVKLAKEIDADGVHVGANDMSVKEARAILRAGKIVGATAKTLEQVDAANSDGADYIGSGAVFGTITKADAKPMSRKLLDEICMRSAIPVVAIGGICLGNIIELNDAKISGVAVVSGIFGQNNIRVAAEKLYAARYGKKVIQCITN